MDHLQHKQAQEYCGTSWAALQQDPHTPVLETGARLQRQAVLDHLQHERALAAGAHHLGRRAAKRGRWVAPGLRQRLKERRVAHARREGFPVAKRWSEYSCPCKLADSVGAAFTGTNSRHMGKQPVDARSPWALESQTRHKSNRHQCKAAPLKHRCPSTASLHVHATQAPLLNLDVAMQEGMDVTRQALTPNPMTLKPLFVSA